MSDSGALTQAQALALLARTSDQGWLASELSGPDGSAIINSRAAIMAAASTALMAQAAATTIADAPGGSPGTCSLIVNRGNTATSIVIPAGYRFQTAEGIGLILQSPVTMSIGVAATTLPLQTLRQTELVNTYDPAFDSLLNPGDLLESSTLGLQAGRSAISPDSPLVFDSAGHIVLGFGSAPPFALTYVSSTNIDGATSDWLSVHGDERSVRRQPGELTEEYRARIRAIPDAVSPLAIATAVNGAASNVGLGQVTLVEMINPGASVALMAASELSFQDTIHDSDYFDDPVGVVLAAKLPERSLETVGLREGRAYFRLDLTGPMQEPDGSVMYYDAAFFDDEDWGYPDDVNPLVIGAILTVSLQADAKKAAGVNARAVGTGTATDLYVEDRIAFPLPGSTSMAPATVVHGSENEMWAISSDPLATPGSETKAWLIRDALVSSSSQTQSGPAVCAITFPVISHLANNDHITITDAAGGFITVEIKVNGSFIPTGGRITADCSAVAGGDAHAVANVVVPVINANSGVQEFLVSAGSGTFTVSWKYPILGTVGNIPTVVFSATPGALSVSGFAGGTDGPVPARTGSVEHRLRFTFSDGTQLISPYWASGDSEHLTISRLQALGFLFKPVVKIEGFLNNPGAYDVAGVVVGTFWAVESALS